MDVVPLVARGRTWEGHWLGLLLSLFVLLLNKYNTAASLIDLRDHMHNIILYCTVDVSKCGNYKQRRQIPNKPKCFIDPPVDKGSAIYCRLQVVSKLVIAVIGRL